MNQSMHISFNAWLICTYLHMYVYLHRTLIVNTKHAWSSWFIKGCFMILRLSKKSLIYAKSIGNRKIYSFLKNVTWWVVHLCDFLFYIRQLFWNSLLQKRGAIVCTLLQILLMRCLLRFFMQMIIRKKKAS